LGGAAVSRVVLAALAGFTATPRCEGQETRSPIFLAEPGMISTDFLSAGSLNSSTAFNFRFETRLPTATSWLTPVIGASIAPYGYSGSGKGALNTPLIFGGNVFPVLAPERTGAWATIEMPVLFYYSYDGGGQHSQRLYGRDLFVQLAVRLHVGRKVLRDLGEFWSRLDAYAFLEQNLTPNPLGTSPRPDRFNPVGLFGAVIPFGGAAITR
jgi:hypothetical protein